MTLIVGATAHGSPGVSTTLQLVASLWPRGRSVPVIVEADASGGVFAARYELSITPGFVTLAESLRKAEAPPLLDHAQRLPSGVACVTLSPSATAASAQLRSAGPYLGSYLAESDHPVLLDVGTLLPDAKIAAAITMADLLLWFVRPTREELLVLRHRMAECSQPESVAVVLVGSTPYDAEQVAEALEVEVLHALPIDTRAAGAANLGGDDRFLRRSQLARSSAKLAELVSSRAAASSGASVPAGGSTASSASSVTPATSSASSPAASAVASVAPASSTPPPSAAASSVPPRSSGSRGDPDPDPDPDPDAGRADDVPDGELELDLRERPDGAEGKLRDEIEITVWQPGSKKADERAPVEEQDLVVWVNDGG